MPDEHDELVARLRSGVAAVRGRVDAACAACGRAPATVRLLPVTKTLPSAWGPALVAAGIATVGENRLDHCQELLAAAPALSVEHVGRLQSRQLSKLPPQVTTIHALDTARHAEKLQTVARAQDRRWRIFIQVNTSGEEQKAGVAPDELSALVAAVRACDRLQLVGLMTMAPDPDLPAVSADWIAETFGRCAALAQAHGLAELSMGMSKDLAAAVAAGSTLVRVGTDCWQDVR